MILKIFLLGPFYLLPRCLGHRGTTLKLNISARIQQKLKSSKGTSNGPRISCLMKKTRHQKSRVTVPLKILSPENKKVTLVNL
jgi:hypothetical protein